MRTLDKNTLAMLATADLTLNDVKPVMVPNVLRGGDDFMAGANDMFMFSFGGPKVREADATVGGVRAVKIGSNLEASRKIFPSGSLSEAQPIPAYVCVSEPIQVYARDYIPLTNRKKTEESVPEIIQPTAHN